MAASATFALKAGVWFRRGRLLIASPDSLGTACPLSGRNSTYRPVQILEASSVTPAAELIYWRSDGFTSLKAHPCGAEQTCPIQLARSQIAKWQEGWALLGLTQWRVRTLPMHK